MIDVSAFGTGITIVGNASFPYGFSLSQFADDEDPITFEDLEVSGFEKLYDGTIFLFDKTSPVLVSVSVMPNTDDDQNLKIMLQMRKSSPQLIPIADSAAMIITYPDGGRVMLASGGILSGAIADSITTQGRKKGNTYHFAFGTFAGAQSATEIAAGVVQNLLSLA
jgi:hypothetical protein